MRRHQRRSVRLKGYDYASAGAYFFTACTQRRICVLNDAIVAAIIWDVWLALPRWFPTIALDEFVVMPNHVHGVVWLQTATVEPGTLDITFGEETGSVGDPVLPGAENQPLRDWILPEPETVNDAPTLGEVLGAFKSLVLTVYLDWVNIHDPARRAKFWQRNFYEHVIRNEHELDAIRQYIVNNPLNWSLDLDNPKNSSKQPPPGTINDYLRDIGINP
jgi:REP element-mobilizing transposase RayT